MISLFSKNVFRENCAYTQLNKIIITLKVLITKEYLLPLRWAILTQPHDFENNPTKTNWKKSIILLLRQLQKIIILLQKPYPQSVCYLQKKNMSIHSSQQLIQQWSINNSGTLLPTVCPRVLSTAVLCLDTKNKIHTHQLHEDDYPHHSNNVGTLLPTVCPSVLSPVDLCLETKNKIHTHQLHQDEYHHHSNNCDDVPAGCSCNVPTLEEFNRIINCNSQMILNKIHLLQTSIEAMQNNGISRADRIEEKINNIRIGSRIGSHSLQNSVEFKSNSLDQTIVLPVVADIKEEIQIYIQRHGFPTNFEFDDDKLNQILCELSEYQHL